MTNVDDLSKRLAALDAKTPEYRARLGAAVTTEIKGLAADVEKLASIITSLTQEYAHLAGAVCDDIRVPKDLRDELGAHAATVLADLQTAIGEL